MKDCPNCEYHKQRAQLWRHEAYKLSGHPLDWEPDLMQRTWVGLTDDDKKEYVAQDFGGNRLDAMDWAAQRLKEKNNG